MPVELTISDPKFSWVVGEWPVNEGSATNIAGRALNQKSDIVSSQREREEQLRHSKSGRYLYLARGTSAAFTAEGKCNVAGDTQFSMGVYQ
jgi:hypothetical protein